MDRGDAHGQVPVRQVRDPSVLPLDHDQDRRIAPGMHRGDFERGGTVGEGTLPTLELAAPVGELNGRSRRSARSG